MATAAELRETLVRNRDKKGSPEYVRLYELYRRKRDEEYSTFKVVQEEPGFLDQIEELAKGIPAGIIGIGELGALGAAALLDEEEELTVRAGIQSVAETLKSPFTADAGSEELVGRKFGEALGSFAGLGLTSLVPGVGLPGATALAAGAGAGEASERARAAGATEAERGEAALKGTFVGLSELIPLGKLRSLRGVLGDNAFLNGIERIKRAAVAGGFEGAQEAAAGVLQNAIQQGYDPTQELLNVEVAEEGGYGAAVGATVQALLDVAVPGRIKARPQTEDEAAIEQELEAFEDDTGAPRPEFEEDIQAQERLARTATETQAEAAQIDEETEAAEEAARKTREERGRIHDEAVAAAKAEFDAGSEFSLEELVSIHQRVRGIPATSGIVAGTVRVQDEVKRRLAEAPVVTEEVEGEPTVTEEETAVTEGETAVTEGETAVTEEVEGEPAVTEEETAVTEEVEGEPAVTEGEVETEAGTAPKATVILDNREFTIQPLSQDDQGVTQAEITDELGETNTVTYIDEEQLKFGIIDSYNLNQDAEMEVVGAPLPELGKIDTEVVEEKVEEKVEKKAEERVKDEVETEIIEEPVGVPPTISTQFRGTPKFSTVTPEITSLLGEVSKAYTDIKPLRDKLTTKGQSESKLKKAERAKLKGYRDAWGENFEAAGAYFSRYDTPESAIRAIAFDYANSKGRKGERVTEYTAADFDEAVPTEVKEFFRGTGGQVAKQAFDWVNTNIENTEVQDRLAQEYTKATEAIEAVTSATVTRGRKEDKAAEAALEKSYIEGDISQTDFISKARDLFETPEKEAPYTPKQLTALKTQRREFAKKRKAEEQKRGEQVEREGAGETRIFTEEEVARINFEKGYTEGAIAKKDFTKETKKLGLKFTKKQREKLEAKREEYQKQVEAERRTTEADVDADVQEYQRNRRIALEQLTSGEQDTFVELADKILAAEARIDSITNPKEFIRTIAAIDRAKLQQNKILAKGYNRAGIQDDLQKIKSRDNPFKGNPLAADAINELMQPLHGGTIHLLANNDLKSALGSISRSSANKRLQTISNKFAGMVGSTQVEVVKGLKDPRDNRPLAGLFDPETNTIKLDSVTGLNEHTVLHEMTHALVSAQIAANTPAAKRLTKLYNEVKDLISNAYGAENVDEFFAEAISNESFRMELARINPKGSPESALAQFVQWITDVIKRLIGWQSVTLKEVDALLDSLASPAPMRREAETLAMNSDVRGAEAALDDLGTTYADLTTTPATKPERKKWVDDVLQFLSDRNMDFGRTFFGAIDLPGIAEIASKYFGDIGRRLQIVAQEQRGAMEKADKRVDAVTQMLIRFRDGKNGDAAYKLLNEIIYSREYGATIHQIDPLLSDQQAKNSYDAEKYATWKQLHAKWVQFEKLSEAQGSGEGKRVYKVLRNFYKQEFLELRNTLYNRVKDVASEAELEKLNTKVLDALFSEKVLDVYFPLARQGRFKIEYSTKPSKDDPEKETYSMEMVDTKAEAIRVKEYLKANEDLVGEPKIVDTREPYTGAYKSPPIGIIEEILRKVDQKLGYEEIQMTAEEMAIREGVRSKIVEVFINSLPETSFAKSLAKRKNTPGYEADALLALQTKGYDLGRQIVRIQYTKKVNDLESELIEDYKEKQGKDETTTRVSALYAELMERASFIRNPPEDKFAQLANQGAFVYTIGFNVSSAIVNLSQIPLFVYPYLAGEYQNMPSAFNEILKASSFVGSSFEQYDVGIDNYYTVDAKGNYSVSPKKLKEATKGLSLADAKKKEAELAQLIPLVQMAAANGQLTKSFLIDELSLQKEAFKSGRERSGNVFRKTLDKITSVSAVGFNVAERFNRQATMVAAYNLELNRISKGNKKFNFTEEQLTNAARKALEMTQETNGGAFREVGPRLSQKGLLRVALMYKTYGFRMYQTMLKSGIRAIKGTTFSSDPKENARLRRVAIRQIIGFHASSALFAGVYGIPLYGAVNAAANLLWLDEEEDDFDSLVRKYIGEIPYKGVVNEILGVDVASRIRLTGLLMQSNKFNANASAEETIGFYIGGPAMSTAKRFGRGVRYLSQGEMERGIENILPAGIANALKASPIGRVYREGYSTLRGDPIYDDVTSGELAGQFFGFAPLEYIRRIEENQNAKKIDDNVRSKRSRLLKKLYISMRINNTADQKDAWDEIYKFNERHPLYSISPSTVKRSIKAHLKTSATMHNGIVLSPQMQTVLRQMREGE